MRKLTESNREREREGGRGREREGEREREGGREGGRERGEEGVRREVRQIDRGRQQERFTQLPLPGYKTSIYIYSCIYVCFI